MRRRLTGAILLLYPRRVRNRHGPEIEALIDDLIAHDGRSRAGLFVRLAADGVVQRLASTVTAWTMVAVLAATTVGGLAVSELAAASALHGAARTVRTTAPASRPPQTAHPRRSPRTHPTTDASTRSSEPHRPPSTPPR
jgi:hypothetical protein